MSERDSSDKRDKDKKGRRTKVLIQKFLRGGGRGWYQQIGKVLYLERNGLNLTN